MDKNWIEIFRAGNYPQGNFTEKDIDGIVRSYAAGQHEAPVVVGHPAHDSPAYGWVSGLRRDGATMLATFRDVADDFSGWVRRGAYRKRSASFYRQPDGGWYLRHVGFLGGQPPQIKGLADVSFADERDAVEVEFADSRGCGMFGRIRDFIMSNFGAAAAEEVIPAADLEAMADEEEEGREKSEPPKEEEVKDEKKEEMSKIQADLKEAQAKLASFAEKERIFAEENRRLKASARKLEIDARLAKLQADGRLTPGMRSLGLAEFLSGLDSSTEIQFAEECKASQAEFVFRLLESMPSHAALKTAMFTEQRAAPATPDKELIEFMKKGMEKGGRNV